MPMTIITNAIFCSNVMLSVPEYCSYCAGGAGISPVRELDGPSAPSPSPILSLVVVGNEIIYSYRATQAVTGPHLK